MTRSERGGHAPRERGAGRRSARHEPDAPGPATPPAWDGPPSNKWLQLTGASGIMVGARRRRTVAAVVLPAAIGARS